MIAVLIVGSDDLMRPVPVGVILPPFPGRTRFLAGHDDERMEVLDWINSWDQDLDPQTWNQLAERLSSYGQRTVNYDLVDVDDPLTIDVNDVFDHYITRAERTPYVPPSG